ncbi:MULTISPECIES: PTS system mannose/fructose/N-acetylgalactosamine-transporter subunit IIB [Gilliamella]|jgi:Phosphotransferase system, mannose/fructose/N-acetylgalactosamine-specific component IIB|uniref:PTS sugar transporter subunit IIB n=2 Tax=Gilliamella TaxID=1193503 RepID=A0A556RS52_9GAMM|nr:MULTISPECIES: PTS sugar transporter subunit IIB [Gilliamella]MBI0113550.1 PTS sugar transporter subunit IIB [Gilliamella sp. W8123]MBI0116913.1 PTS sugar transporter subunit IIB [Gilliamella sp. W8129]MBI0154077.1 PTS sugar transporter subunit IIB [Gilliamella sp. W8128]MBI0155599.1 PTS sugar transporter subunit IIB [Gilliamella sp. M0364]MCT6884740.1 PTS sugar transporter subunit IIB [Gilliamella apis]
MPINVARIDDRLIHGQVITTWVKNYDIEQVLVINDKVAEDKVQQSVLTMSAPPGLKVLVFGVQQFIEILKKTPIKKRTMLLFTNSIDVNALVEGGLSLEKVNVGGMRMQDGRHQLSRAVSVTPEEEQAFKNLIAKNIPVEVQMVPKDPIVDLKSLLN